MTPRLGLALALLLAGCEGLLLDGASGPSGAPPRTPTDPTRPTDPTDPADPTDPTVPIDPAADAPGPQTRASRLTHAEWRATATDLLRLEGAFPTDVSFRADPRSTGFLFDNQGATLEVDEVLLGAYRRAAADLAQHVTSDDARLARAGANEGASDDARAASFIADLGERAHRRPLSDDERAEYLALYQAGRDLYLDASSPHVAGLRLVIEAFLLSPEFLYRIERSADPLEGEIPLDDYEIASRLSYFFTGSMPDGALFEAARTGALRTEEGVRVEAARLLASPRAVGVVQRFHAQLLDADRFQNIRPATDRFPDAPSDFGVRARRELDLFVEHVVFTREGTYADLLTSTETFVDDELARVYGVSGTFGSEPTLVSLDASQRRGFLTLSGILASHATSVDPDPIHRGVFVAERIACVPIAAPPDDIPPLPAAMGRTNRETVEEHTETNPICASCHQTLINPFGFPFEGYDAIGAWRTTDNDMPVRTDASPFVDREPTPVADAIDLAETLAASGGAHVCYAQHWVEAAMGRPHVESDANLVSRLAQGSRSGALAVTDLMIEIAASRAFRARSMEELP